MKSMIVVTHDLAVLYQIADTIMVMYAGRLAEKAPAETIVRAPAAPVHAAADRLAAGGRRALRGRAADGIPGGPPSLLDPPAGCRFRARCPLAPRGAPRSRRSSRSSRATRGVLEGAA